MRRAHPGRLAAALVAAAALAAALAAPGGAAADALAETGREEFVRYCAACHGAQATGDGPVAPVLRATPPDLTRLAARSGGAFPAANVQSVIDGRFAIEAHGTRTMPVWGRVLGQPIADQTTADEVSRGRIDALVRYLESIQR